MRNMKARQRSQAKARQTKALKLAVILGSLLFAVNHSHALARGEMTAHRWFSATLGVLIPFATGIYCPCAQPSRDHQ